MKLNSGTKNTDHNNGHGIIKNEVKIDIANMTDLRDIISLAKDNGVIEFEGFGLKIKFRSQDPSRNSKQSQPNAPYSPSDPDAYEEARQAQLMIDDPLSFEQEMIDAQLEGFGDRSQNPGFEQDLLGC